MGEPARPVGGGRSTVSSSVRGEADLRQRDVPGAIEIVLDYQPGKVSVKEITLAGGELEARRWLRGAGLKLGQTKMNERYEVRFAGAPYRLVFGVAPDRGLQLETLGTDQLAVLKLLVSGDPVTPFSVRQALDGAYDRFSDDDARAGAAAIVTLAGAFTTAAMKEES